MSEKLVEPVAMWPKRGRVHILWQQEVFFFVVSVKKLVNLFHYFSPASFLWRFEPKTVKA
jgi:hypothetical protein